MRRCGRQNRQLRSTGPSDLVTHTGSDDERRYRPGPARRSRAHWLDRHVVDRICIGDIAPTTRFRTDWPTSRCCDACLFLSSLGRLSGDAIFAGLALMLFFIIWCFVDNFRRRDHHGFAKAGWTILILFLSGVRCADLHPFPTIQRGRKCDVTFEVDIDDLRPGRLSSGSRIVIRNIRLQESIAAGISRLVDRADPSPGSSSAGKSSPGDVPRAVL